MEIVERFKIDEHKATLLIKALSENAVNLLLGAGGSAGATGGDGSILKGAAALAEELNTKFTLDLDTTESSNLSLVYSDLESSEATKPSLNTYLKRKFSNCKPTWQEILHNFHWKRIWTLNIDDIIEKSQPRNSQFKLEQHLWLDKLQPRPQNRKTIQTIYLHGRASKLEDLPNHLIFSLKEYAARQESSPGWHAEFRTEWVKKPFIVCGARLQEEFDLITTFEHGSRSYETGGAPSIIVLPEIKDGQKKRFIRQGLLPVEAKGEEFFQALHNDLKAWLEENATDSPSFMQAKSEIAAKFKKLSFTELPQRKLLDFYASAETQWTHILQDLDAKLSGSRNSTEFLTRDSTKLPKIALFHGDSTSGKTAAALRTAYSLMNKGFEAWLFRGEERFNEGSIIEYSKNKKVVFIFDDCADFSSSLKETIDQSGADKKTHITLIATCDTHRLRAVRADIIEADRLEIPMNELDRSDFLSIFTKRSEKGRLGKQSNLSKSNAWKEFKSEYDQKLLEWLESLENAYAFTEAITKLVTSPNSLPTQYVKLLFATSAVHRFGYSLPFEIADYFSGKNDAERAFDQESAISQIGYSDEKGLRLRSSAFSNFIWKQAGGYRFDISLLLAKLLSPLVNPQTIARRTLPYLVLRALMDHKIVDKDLGSRGDEWYKELEEPCRWNARFWEQRALLASHHGNEEHAYSYAKKAVAILEHDSFPHTTLGKICIKIGISRQDSVGVERFWEGVEELKISRNLAVDNGLEWEHPYITFFTYALQAINLPHFADEREKLNSNWSIWMKQALQSKALNFDDEGKTNLESLKNQWIFRNLTTTA
ncbi:hypothetical protein N5C55_10680 [Pseudomonas otitidis]|uniref:P-loop NTPase n=1 Tax=Metapseudomonas otitidis TaxID=319939 RepID=UPI00244CBAD7|nr:hypothetical protein [Pseudomonas otitidis]MDH1105336.1 hypothetical protein [Pseudomonas otitidis]MDH1158632.1 hypothetical protein [Pseudomonas otitidis]MDH1164947.1 hypothetical protein [Pseudomonas otitidis]